MQIVEAVPNISEGKNASIVNRVRAAAEEAGVRVLHLDSNANANRTVLTLAGTPPVVTEGAFRLIRAAAEWIDMRWQHGVHPRLGATDVCPLVPVRGISLAETADWADRLARRVAEELHIPVYLYEQNAHRPLCADLSFIRRGEYEQLATKLRALPPDYGPQEWNERTARTGASVIGARQFLIAFNMSLDTRDVVIARQIAAKLREKNGGLKAVKAIGWYMADYGCAQVSCNLTDYTQTSLAVLFETCRREAAAHGTRVTAGELIGLIPQQALVEAGRWYAPQEKDVSALMQTAAEKLLLDGIRPFQVRERVLEYVLGL